MIFFIALALALDAFAVTIGIGTSLHGLNWRASLRLAFHFGFFQFIMPILGFAVGERIISLVRDFDHWIAFLILGFVGSRMVISALKNGQARPLNEDRTKGMALIFLSVATSLDALAVGLTLPALRIPILFGASVIGVVAFNLTLLAAVLSRYLGRLAGKGAEIMGGLALIGVGLRIVLTHL